MPDNGCEELRLLIQADVDGELQPAEAARIGAHVQRCPSCTEVQARLVMLSDRVRQAAVRYSAPDTLRSSVRASIAAAVPAPAPPARRPLPRAAAPFFGAGFALAACLALFVLLPGGLPGGGGLPDAIVAAHIRALQPGHLMDVVSTDQHTVKPWFDGRLPFAPPVKDLAKEDYPLLGGRLDYIAGHTAATLVYGHGKHVIDLFVWPIGGSGDQAPEAGSRDGYNFLRWRQGGMSFWAVSDVDPRGLAEFVHDWQTY
jgi:anti-sigma factor RsiW